MYERADFGAWLRERRKQLDLTQEELADQLGCSRDLIKKIELGQRRPSRQMAELLGARLAVPDEQQPAFVQFARGTERAGHLILLPSPLTGRDESPQPAAVPPNNLPAPVTSFIGREMELATIVRLLSREDVRLLTLTGPGGTGKTRLALQLAAHAIDDFLEGVWFVNLAPIGNADLVIFTIAQTLGVRETGDQPLIDTLKTYLKKKVLLLLLDNFEHVLGAAASISVLLASCPQLKVLVTSRVALQLSGEQEYLVPALHTPDPKRLPSIESVTQYEAVRLFTERAQRVQGNFEVKNENALAVAEICARLDGLPLAIELAAARIRILPPRAMLSQLQNRLKLLAGGGRDLPTRQKTIRNTIQWSYDLFSEAEKQLFRRMAVFQGGRTLEALEAVCNYDGLLRVDVLEGVEGLVQGSLLQQRQGRDGEAWFWMLETIHEYAMDKLEESGEADALQREHALYFMTLAELAEPHLRGAKQVEWLDRLLDEYDNMRAALGWEQKRIESLGAEREGDSIQKAVEAAEMGLRTTGALWRFWIVNDMRRGREYLEGLLSLPQDVLQACSPSSRAKGLNAAGELALRLDDISSARSLGEAALALGREAGDKRSMAFALNVLAGVERFYQDFSAARVLQEESLTLRRELQDKWGISSSLNNLGVLAYQQGDYQSARVLQEESLALDRELGDKRGIAVTGLNLGVLAYLRGDYHASRALLDECLALARELGDASQIAWTFFTLGKLEHLLGDHLAANSFYKEALSIYIDIDFTSDYALAACLGGLAGVLADAERPHNAARLLGAAEAHLHISNDLLGQEDLTIYQEALASARTQLGEEAFEKAWQEGRAMSTEEAIEYGLQES